ncbi:hypothetical protein VTN77DRAFT_6546 [Rasamsonia byssochlamydoides]|uniref:uncharacterized protein n=1 Tax=Rasamsonia byssochlamydoides TaxID=89139 RepID=UPI0037439009
MATSFVEDLWSSIFTPGPTPSLLVATNATFAALQVLLFVLLIATYSIHFVVLSFLSGALWWSINWFAREIQEIRAREEEEQRKAKLAEENKRAGGIDSTDSETETEAVSGNRRRRGPATSSSHTTSSTAAAALSSPVPSEDGALRERRRESSGYVSTDSEWEKVDGGKSA